MFFCAPCRPSRPTCFLHGPLTTVWSAVKVRRMTSDSCARGRYCSGVRFAMNVRENGPRWESGAVVESQREFSVTATTLVELNFHGWRPAAYFVESWCRGETTWFWGENIESWCYDNRWLRRQWRCIVWSWQQSVESVTCDDRTACLATTWTSWPSCPCTTTVEVRAREGWPSARPTGRVIRVVRSRLDEWRQFVVPSSSRLGRQPTVLNPEYTLDHVLNFIISFSIIFLVILVY